MADYRAGPWKWYWRHEDGEANCGVYSEERPGMAYSICRAPRYVSEEEWAVHAQLLSATPELLAALRHALKCIEDSHDFRIGNPAFEQAQAAALAVIRKATGTP